MKASIWEFERSYEEPVVGLSLGARKRVFAAMEEILGAELFVRLRGDWRAGQARGCAGCSPITPGGCGWRRPVGSPSVWLPPGCIATEVWGRFTWSQSIRRPGSGVGTALTGVATGWLRRPGLLVAVIEAGGGPGHAAARRVCEEAGYTALPAVRFFRAL